MSGRAKGVVLFVYNQRKRGAARVAAEGRRWCRDRGIAVRTTPRRTIELEDVSLVVAIGGDGTLLRVASAIYPREIPVFGVNVGGALGFLSAGGPDDLVRLLEEYAAGNFRLEPRLRLAVEVGGSEFSALNDIVFTGPGTYRFTQLEASIGGTRVLAFSGDGLIVSTPTGSTAYALACGGPLLYPAAEAILLMPIAPHDLKIRPIVLPASVAVEVRALYATNVFVDGDKVSSLRPGEVAVIKRAPACTTFVRFFREPGFFERVARCFGWPL
ncbi:NAD(+)/NADH kinase [Candidatus Bipolaricaulota sp. J31]